jgi:hypothetical protein
MKTMKKKQKQESENQYTSLNVRMPKQLKKQLHIRCINDGITIQEEIVRMLQKELA